jgi:3-hydroxyacyl-CoA dehydrogenase
VITDRDIYRSAQVLVKRYGHDAEFEAAERCDAMIEAGDPEGLAVWKRILRAVDALLAQEPQNSRRLH